MCWSSAGLVGVSERYGCRPEGQCEGGWGRSGTLQGSLLELRGASSPSKKFLLISLPQIVIRPRPGPKPWMGTVQACDLPASSTARHLRCYCLPFNLIPLGRPQSWGKSYFQQESLLFTEHKLPFHQGKKKNTGLLPSNFSWKPGVFLEAKHLKTWSFGTLLCFAPRRPQQPLTPCCAGTSARSLVNTHVGSGPRGQG